MVGYMGSESRRDVPMLYLVLCTGRGTAASISFSARPSDEPRTVVAALSALEREVTVLNPPPFVDMMDEPTVDPLSVRDRLCAKTFWPWLPVVECFDGLDCWEEDCPWSHRVIRLERSDDRAGEEGVAGPGVDGGELALTSACSGVGGSGLSSMLAIDGLLVSRWGLLAMATGI